jgi:hypothetical protein
MTRYPEEPMPDKSSDTMKRTARTKRRKPSRAQKKTQPLSAPRDLRPSGPRSVKGPIRNKG